MASEACLTLKIASVCLSVFIERHYFCADDPGGDHIERKLFFHTFPHIRRYRIAQVKSNDPFPVRVKYTAAFFHMIDAVQGAFDLFQFDPASHVLDLKIFPSRKDKFPVFVIICQITRAVKKFFFSGTVCPSDKTARCGFRIPVIAAGDRLSCHTDLAPPGRGYDLPAILVKEKDLASGIFSLSENSRPMG